MNSCVSRNQGLLASRVSSATAITTPDSTRFSNGKS